MSASSKSQPVATTRARKYRPLRRTGITWRTAAAGLPGATRITQPNPAQTTIEISPAVIDRVRDRAAESGVPISDYVSAALERQLERAALDDILSQMVAEHGPVDEAKVGAAAVRLIR